MGEVASAYVTLMPSAKGFGGKLQSEIGGDLDTAGKAGGRAYGGGMLGGLKGVMGPIAALFAVGAVVSFFKGANDEAREAQKVGALTTNVIKTTGGAAKVTAAQVGDLSTAISNKTGVDDEAIQSGANLLLTFKNVKNEVGSGAQIFDRATAAAVDLSASGFGDVAGSSKMLGKALNDPIAGITALGRAGVTFTAAQKKQIKTMVESGDTLGAQKMIMAEVESQVGGAAAATATAGEKAAVAFGNLKEQVGTAMLPVIDKLATLFSTVLVPALSTAVTWVTGFFSSFSAGGGPGRITTLFAPLVTFFQTVLVPAFATLVTFFQTQIVPAFMSIVTAVQAFVAVALPIVQAFVAGMMARIQPMMPTIMGIFTTIGSIITAAMGLIQAVIERVTTVIAFVWNTWGSNIMDFIAGVWAKILVVIQAALSIIQGVIKTVTSIIKGDWSGAWDGIKGIMSGVWELIKSVISLGLTYIKGILSAAWALIKTGVSTAWGGIVDYFKSIPGRIVSALGSLGSLLFNAGSSILSGLWDGMKAKFEDVKKFVSGIGTWIADHKGPKAYDLKLLRPAGGWIMDGLGAGIEAEIPALRTTLGLVTGAIQTGGAGSLDFASTADRASAVGGGSGGGATSADIAALGDRIDATMQSVTRMQQTMQRQMAGAR